MNDDSRLTFSSNGFDVNLRTQHGSLLFPTEEFSLYQNLYRIIDCFNEGTVTTENIHLLSLLIRCNANQMIMEKAFFVSCGISPNFQSSVSSTQQDNKEGQQQVKSKGTNSKTRSLQKLEAAQTASSANSLTPKAKWEEKRMPFNQWLLLCKILAHYQETNRTPSEKLLKMLHTMDTRKSSFVDFNLGKVVNNFSMGRLHFKYQVKILGWQLTGEDYNTKHTKYSITTTYRVANNSVFQLPIAALDQSSVQIERRYTDFELFAGLLQQFFKGFILPPLPLKNWGFSFISSGNSDHVLNRRVVEFQMFLNDISSHPVLAETFEVHCFLTASTTGFKAFLDLYQHFDLDANGKPMYYQDKFPSNPKSGSNGVGKLLLDSSSAISQSFLSSAKSFDFVNSLWGNVSRTVTNIASPLLQVNANSNFQHQLHNSSEDSLLQNKTKQFLDHLCSVSKCYEKLHSIEEAKIGEVGKIASCFKNTSEYEVRPDLVKILQLTHASMTQLAKKHSEILFTLVNTVAIPLNYIGRYSETFGNSLRCKSQVQDLLLEALKNEQDRKKKLEALLPNSSSSSSSNQSTEDFLIKSGYPDDSSYPTTDSETSHQITKEEEINYAKLSLVEAENLVELRKHEESTITSVLRDECLRLKENHTKVLLESLLMLVHENRKVCSSLKEYWSELKGSLES